MVANNNIFLLIKPIFQLLILLIYITVLLYVWGPYGDLSQVEDSLLGFFA